MQYSHFILVSFRTGGAKSSVAAEESNALNRHHVTAQFHP
jgi:hypothetical protein